MTNFLDKIKKDQNQETENTGLAQDSNNSVLSQEDTTSTSIPTTAASTLQPERADGFVQDRPDIVQAHAALDGLMANVSTGIQNSQSAIPAPAFAQRHNFGQVVNGMEKPGFYSSTKGKVKGKLATQVGGRFYFPLDSSDELLEELDKLVEAGIYEKVEG